MDNQMEDTGHPMTRTTAVMEMELKPCPCCRGKAFAYQTDDEYRDCIVECEKCGIRTSFTDTMEGAIAAWNHRTPAEPLADGEMIEKVARAIYDECRILEQEEHGGDIQSPWTTLDTKQHEQMKRVARAAITAYNPNDRLRVALVALADAADKCAEAPHFILQPFLNVYRKHGETIAEARAALSHKD